MYRHKIPEPHNKLTEENLFYKNDEVHMYMVDTENKYRKSIFRYYTQHMKRYFNFNIDNHITYNDDTTYIYILTEYENRCCVIPIKCKKHVNIGNILTLFTLYNDELLFFSEPNNNIEYLKYAIRRCYFNEDNTKNSLVGPHMKKELLSHMKIFNQLFTPKENFRLCNLWEVPFDLDIDPRYSPLRHYNLTEDFYYMELNHNDQIFHFLKKTKINVVHLITNEGYHMSNNINTLDLDGVVNFKPNEGPDWIILHGYYSDKKDMTTILVKLGYPRNRIMGYYNENHVYGIKANSHDQYYYSQILG